jgi:hypothetical protein
MERLECQTHLATRSHPQELISDQEKAENLEAIKHYGVSCPFLVSRRHLSRAAVFMSQESPPACHAYKK